MQNTQAELSDVFSHNYTSHCSAGRLLGRCHAALGQHSLSLAAFDAAMSVAEAGQYKMSGTLTVRDRAMAGREAGGAGGHWSARAGEEQLTEAVGRMAGDRAAIERLLQPPSP